MELEVRVDKLADRVNALEKSETGIQVTLTHFTNSVDSFIKSLETHEQKEDVRFAAYEKDVKFLTKVAYFGIGGLLLLQFLISSGILKWQQ